MGFINQQTSLGGTRLQAHRAPDHHAAQQFATRSQGALKCSWRLQESLVLEKNGGFHHQTGDYGHFQ